MDYDHQMSFMDSNGSSRPTLSQNPSTIKDNSHLKYDSVPASEDNLPPSLSQQEYKTHIFGWWKYELLASVISIGTIMALALVVRRFEGVPLQDINLPKSLQLSAIVAALSTVVRVSLLVPVTSAMSQDSWLWMSNPSQLRNCHSRLKDLDLMDNATRGPWGSLLFLFKARRRYFAYIGALITILSLGLSTFTQQIVVPEVLPIAKGIPTLANIARSQSWSYQQGSRDAVVSYINPQIKAAVYNGLFAPNVEYPSLSCPTGNCTWPTTPSLAVCGDCAKTGFTRYCDPTERFRSCNYTLPSGNSFKNGTGLNFKAQISAGAIYNSSDPKRLYLANFVVAGVANKSLSWMDWDDQHFVSYECALWVCVQSYSASVQASTQIQTLNETWSDVIGVQNSSNSYLQNVTFGNPSHQKSHSSNGSDEYTATLMPVTMLTTFMGQFFNGSVGAAGSRGIVYTDSYIEVIYNATGYSDLSGLVKNLARSMSNVFRTAEPAHNDAYNGVASTLSVAVKWKWLAFPIILVFASFVLSLINIIRTARSDVGAWKGSPLAMLFSGVDDHVRGVAMQSVGEPNGLVRSVGNTKTVLVRDGRGGWVFAAA